MGQAREGSEEVGEHHSRSFPSSNPLLPIKGTLGGESIPGGRNGKCKGCGLRMWRRRKPSSLAGNEVGAPWDCSVEKNLFDEKERGRETPS